MEQYARLTDLKGVGKVPHFNGNENAFPDWKWKFEIAMSLLNIKSIMDQARTQVEPVELSSLDEQQTIQSQMLFAILAQALSGKALSILKLIENNNGLEAWRRLCQTYEPDNKVRDSRMLARYYVPRSLTI